MGRNKGWDSGTTEAQEGRERKNSGSPETNYLELIDAKSLHRLGFCESSLDNVDGDS
jgi:hypothetical protein